MLPSIAATILIIGWGGGQSRLAEDTSIFCSPLARSVAAPEIAASAAQADDFAQLVKKLKSQSAVDRREAAEHLGDLGDHRALEPLTAALKDSSADVRAAAA